MSSVIPIEIKKGELTLEQFKHSNICSLVVEYLKKKNIKVTRDNIKSGINHAYLECQKEFSTNHFVKNIIYHKIKEKTLQKPVNLEKCNVLSSPSNLKISSLDEFINHLGISEFFNKTHVPIKFPDQIEEFVSKWPSFAAKFYEKYKVNESFQSIIHKIIDLYEKYQKDQETFESRELQENVSAPEKEDVIVHQPSPQQSPTEADEIISQDKSLQIEQAYVLEESLFSQQILQQSDSVDPLMNSTHIKPELSYYGDSVFIIEQSPEKPIIIDDSFLIEPVSQKTDTDESMIGKAEREACKRLDDFEYE